MSCRFDPRVALGSPIAAPVLTPDRVAPERLQAALEAVQGYFPRPARPKLQWGKTAATIDAIEFLKVARQTVTVHPMLAHPKIPDDVLEGAVFLGVVLWWGAKAQKRLREHPIDVPELAAWVEDQMTLHPAAEFVGKLIERAPTFAQRL